MVGGETRRIENKEKAERKLILWVFGWREEDDEKLVSPMFFLTWPTKIVSPQFVEKIKGRGIVAVND